MSSHRGQTAFSDSLCARLCHEIAGPLGTLSGALDLAAADAAAAREGMQLAGEAAAQLVQRLKLLRAAWAGDCGPLSAAGLAELATGMPPRIRVDLARLAGEFPGPVARVLLNMLLMGVEAMPRGGSMSLQGAPDDDVLLVLTGPAAAWPPGLALGLLDPGAAGQNDPKFVQGPLAAALAQAAGLRLSLLLPSGAPGAAAAPLLLSAA